MRTAIGKPIVKTLLLCAFGLAACGPRTEPFQTAALPDGDGYLTAVPAGDTRISNDSLADIFTKLTYFYEDGSRRHGLYRFEEPITVNMIGDGVGQYQDFLSQVVSQIREEAGLDLQIAPEPTKVLIRFIPGEQFLPHTNNQCIIISGQPSWPEFVRKPRDYVTPAKDAPLVMVREGVLIPDTIEPYKVRQCILEELMQVLGTSNDLFGLGSSMFNDDQAHYWPTKLDYLMLQVLYDPQMETGLSIDEARTRAREILRRLNPEGEEAPALLPVHLHAFKDWREQLQELSNDDLSAEDALVIARKLVAEASRRAPGSAHVCLGRATLAFLAQAAEDPRTPDHFDAASELCTAIHGPDDIRIANLRLGKAYDDYAKDRYRKARDEASALIPVFKAHGQDDRLAAALILETTAAIFLEDPEWQDVLLPRTERWAAYAFGEDHELTNDLRR